MALDHLVTGLLEFATNEQGSKSVTKALKEGGKETLDRFVKRMAESTKGYDGASGSHCNHARSHKFHSGRRAIIVDLALSVTGSQLIASVLPNVSRPPHPPGLYLTATSSGRQGPAHTFVRVDSWAYRHSPWLQDGFEGHLVIVSNVSFWGYQPCLFSLTSVTEW